MGNALLVRKNDTLENLTFDEMLCFQRHDNDMYSLISNKNTGSVITVLGNVTIKKTYFQMLREVCTILKSGTYRKIIIDNSTGTITDDIYEYQANDSFNLPYENSISMLYHIS